MFCRQLRFPVKFSQRNYIQSNRLHRFLSSNPTKSNHEDGEETDYLAIHRPNLFWFPPKNPTPANDAREIGPYPPCEVSSNDPSLSAQFRPADLPDYFDRQGRRRFGETVPEEAEFQGIWNVDFEGDYSVIYMLSGVVVFFGVLGGIAYFSTKMHDPSKSFRLQATEKELPYQSKHYPDSKKSEQPVFFWSELLSPKQ